MAQSVVRQYRKEAAVVGLPLAAVVGWLYTQTAEHGERIAEVKVAGQYVEQTLKEIKEKQKENKEDLDRKLDKLLDLQRQQQAPPVQVQQAPPQVFYPPPASAPAVRP